MATLRGLAVVWGIDLTASGGWASGVIVSDHEYSLESAQKEIMNAVGDTVGVVFSNVKKALSITLIPAHASSQTTARTNNVLPDIGTIVTITSTYAPDIDALHSVDASKYIFIGGSKTASQESEQRMTFNLVQYVANDVAVAIA